MFLFTQGFRFLLYLFIFLFVSCNYFNKKEEVNSKITHLTAKIFQEKIFDYKTNQNWKYEGELPCIIDFYAEWCGPCKRVAPILEELALEYKGKISIYKIDTEKEQELSAIFEIRSIPSFLFVPIYGQPKMMSGAMSKEEFIQQINETLLAK